MESSNHFPLYPRRMHYKISLIIIIFLHHEGAKPKYLYQYTMVSTVTKRIETQVCVLHRLKHKMSSYITVVRVFLSHFLYSWQCIPYGPLSLQYFTMITVCAFIMRFYQQSKMSPAFASEEFDQSLIPKPNPGVCVISVLPIQFLHIKNYFLSFYFEWYMTPNLYVDQWKAGHRSK